MLKNSRKEMKAAKIRNKLHQFIDSAEDKNVKATYSIFKESIEEEGCTAEFNAELDKRYEEYKKDGKLISRQELDKQIKTLLKKTK
jgi:hypothetical protein